MGDIVHLAVPNKDQDKDQGKGKGKGKEKMRAVPTFVGPVAPPLFLESSGLLCHLLESRLYSLLSVLTDLNSSQMKALQFDVIRHASKEEVRVMTAILAIRQLFLLEGCSALQRTRPMDANVCWLWTLEPVGVWETVRLLSNVKDILSAESSAPDADEKLLVAIRNCMFHLQSTSFGNVSATGAEADLSSFYGSVESRKLRKQSLAATPSHGDSHGAAGTAGADRHQHDTTGSNHATTAQAPRTPSRPTAPPPSKPAFRDVGGSGGRGKYTVAHEFAVAFRKTMNSMRAIERYGIGAAAEGGPSLMQSVLTSYLYGLLKRLGKGSTRSAEKTLSAMKVAGIVRTAEEDMSLMQGGVGAFSWPEVVLALVAWTIDVTPSTTNDPTKPGKGSMDLSVVRLKWKKGLRKLLIVSRFLSRKKCTAPKT
jgi:hypothetical protein